MHKTSGRIIGRFPTEKPFYTYHHVNAWEEPQADGCGVLLHVDMIAYSQPIGLGGYDDFTLHKLRRSIFRIARELQLTRPSFAQQRRGLLSTWIFYAFLSPHCATILCRPPNCTQCARPPLMQVGDQLQRVNALLCNTSVHKHMLIAARLLSSLAWIPDGMA